MDKPEIVDDGTLDTIVEYKGQEFRFDTEYRFTFERTEDFLESIIPKLEDEMQDRAFMLRYDREGVFGIDLRKREYDVRTGKDK